MAKKGKDQLFEKCCYKGDQINRLKLNGGRNRTVFVFHRQYEIMFSNVEESGTVESKQLHIQRDLVQQPLCVWKSACRGERTTLRLQT